MYIGASFKCNEYCEQDDKRKYDKFHAEHRHAIFDSKSFKQDNQSFMRKSKRAWNSFSIRLESFFKKLRNELNFIQQQAYNRLELQQIKSAISTEDKHLRNISIDIIQSRCRNLKCKDIDQFLQLRKKQQNVQYINIQREEDNFAHDLVDQVSSFFRDISNDLKPKNERKKDPQDNRNINKDREYHNIRQREAYKKEYPANTQKNQDRNYREERNRIPQKRERQKYQRKVNEPEQKIKRDQYHQKSKTNDQRRQEPKTKRPERDLQRRENRNLRSRDEEPQPMKRNYQNSQKQEQHHRQKPCPLLRLNELTSSSNAFDIELKIVNFVKNLYGKQMWRATDQSGELMVVLPPHNAIKEGAKIKIHNCYTKSFNQKLQIYTKANSKISYLNVKQQKFAQKHYNYNSKEDRKRETNTQQKGLTKIQILTPDLENIKLIAKVISVKNPKQQDYQCVLGDQTGIVNAKFQGYDQFLKIGKMVYFRGIDVQVDDCSHMYLTGKKVYVELAHDEIKSVKMQNNLSLREYQLVE